MQEKFIQSVKIHHLYAFKNKLKYLRFFLFFCSLLHSFALLPFVCTTNNSSIHCHRVLSINGERKKNLIFAIKLSSRVMWQSAKKNYLRTISSISRDEIYEESFSDGNSGSIFDEHILTIFCCPLIKWNTVLSSSSYCLRNVLVPSLQC